MEHLSSFCGILLVVSGLLKAFFLKFISHSMVDSVWISSVKTSILVVQFNLTKLRSVNSGLRSNQRWTRMKDKGLRTLVLVG